MLAYVLHLGTVQFSYNLSLRTKISEDITVGTLVPIRYNYFALGNDSSYGVTHQQPTRLEL